MQVQFNIMIFLKELILAHQSLAFYTSIFKFRNVCMYVYMCLPIHIHTYMYEYIHDKQSNKVQKYLSCQVMPNNLFSAYSNI